MQTGHRVVFAAIGVATAVALGIGWRYHTLHLALAVALPLLLVSGLTLLLASGRSWASVVLSLALAGLVALHIQLSLGTTEFHFGVFVALALVLVYRDWRPIVGMAVFFAVHHLLFDRLQAAGLGFYCTTAPDLGRIALHASYVVVQSVLEVMIALRMAALAREGEELRALVGRLQSAQGIRLDTAGVVLHSAGAHAMRDALQRMAHAVSRVRDASGCMDATSAEIAQGNHDLSVRTEEQSLALEQTTSSVAQLRETQQHTAHSAEQANDLAVGASRIAHQGGQVVAQVVQNMEAIHDSSSRIADITSVIDSIAFQTNILALNAAVEAARAGEQGRGFAVVAGEVRALAQRSAQAAREIKVLIGDSVGRVEQGAVLAGQAGTTMAQVVDAIQRVTDIVGTISAASGEQSRRMGAVAHSMAQMDQATVQNAALVEEMAAVAEGLRQQAQELMGAVSAFDTGRVRSV